MVICKLEKGETMKNEGGSMALMTSKIKMESSTGGGILKGLGRALAGDSIFLNFFTAEEDDQEIGFANSFPGKIIPIELDGNKTIIAQKSAYLASEKDVDINMHFRKKLGTGLFGGEGLFLSTLTGPGKVWVQTMPLSNFIEAIIPYIPRND